MFDNSFKNRVVCGYSFKGHKITIYSGMDDNQEKPAWLVLVLVALGSLVGLLIGSAIGMGIGSLIYSGEGDFLLEAVNPTDEHMRVPLLVAQGIISLSGFLIAPYFVWKTLRKKDISYFKGSPLHIGSLMLVLLVVVSFAVADSAVIEWNQNMQFPDFLKSFETWARDKENQLAELTQMLVKFDSFGEFVIGFVVVAILAGICEEFLFRGIIQTEFLRGTKNIHVAIWISAFLFSAIHSQFFGFIPRMLLGVLFGYLYHWSGNLIVPMFAHFVNNGFSVAMMYLHQLGMIDVNIDAPEAAPWPAVVGFAILTFVLLAYLKKFYESRNASLS